MENKSKSTQAQPAETLTESTSNIVRQQDAKNDSQPQSRRDEEKFDEILKKIKDPNEKEASTSGFSQEIRNTCQCSHGKGIEEYENFVKHLKHYPGQIYLIQLHHHQCNVQDYLHIEATGANVNVETSISSEKKRSKSENNSPIPTNITDEKHPEDEKEYDTSIVTDSQMRIKQSSVEREMPESSSNTSKLIQQVTKEFPRNGKSTECSTLIEDLAETLHKFINDDSDDSETSTDKDDGLEDEEWYDDDLSKKAAETKLKLNRKEGSFIVRRSTTDQNAHTLSVLSYGGSTNQAASVRHYRINRNCHGWFYINESHPQPSLKGLVRYHRFNSGGLITRLKQPPLLKNKKDTAFSWIKHSNWFIKSNDLKEFEQIGEGEFSIVMRAEMQGKKKVAIKKMKLESSKEDVVEEAKLMSRLNHMNIVEFYGVVYEEELVWIVMELMEKGNLADFLKQNLELLQHPAKLIEFCLQICSAMEYLEKMKIIHRDVAARNCLVDKETNIKLADFGNTRYVLDDEYICSPGRKFPIRWASPEVIEFHKFSSKSDVWAFGVLMWEVFSGGRRPYDQKNGQQIVNLVVAGKQLPNPESCPDEIYNIMQACWDMNAMDRPSFKQLLEKLQRTKSSQSFNGSLDDVIYVIPNTSHPEHGQPYFDDVFAESAVEGFEADNGYVVTKATISKTRSGESNIRSFVSICKDVAGYCQETKNRATEEEEGIQGFSPKRAENPEVNTITKVLRIVTPKKDKKKDDIKSASSSAIEKFPKTVKVTNTIGRNGGKITFEDYKECYVEFPSGALDDDVTFHLTLILDLKNKKSDEFILTPILDCQPSMIFNKPVTMSLPTCYNLDSSEVEVVPQKFDQNTHFWVDKQPVEHGGGTSITFKTQSFSRWRIQIFPGRDGRYPVRSKTLQYICYQNPNVDYPCLLWCVRDNLNDLEITMQEGQAFRGIFSLKFVSDVQRTLTLKLQCHNNPTLRTDPTEHNLQVDFKSACFYENTFYLNVDGVGNNENMFSFPRFCYSINDGTRNIREGEFVLPSAVRRKIVESQTVLNIGGPIDELHVRTE